MAWRALLIAPEAAEIPVPCATSTSCASTARTRTTGSRRADLKVHRKGGAEAPPDSSDPMRTTRPVLALSLSALALAGLAGPSLVAQGSPSAIADAALAGFTYRALGPYRAGSWMSDIAVPDGPPPAHLYTFYVAVRYGGLWKTTNNGTTFEPVFDGQDVTGIGCVSVAPSNANIVWVGSGDAAERARGLPRERRVQVRPTPGRPGSTWASPTRSTSRESSSTRPDPDIVYVAAMGRLWSPQRGAGRLQDDRRRQDLEEGALRQRHRPARSTS